MFYIKRLFALFIILCFVGLVISCSASKSNNDKSFADTVIVKDTMVLLLIDLHISEGIIKQQYSNHPSVNYYSKNYFEQILKKYNTNSRKFKSSIRYYTQHANVFDKIYEEVINKLNEIHNVENETGRLQGNAESSTDTSSPKPVGLPKIFEILKNKPGNQ